MGTTLTIRRTDHTSAELRALAGKCRDGAQVRRLLALAMVLVGCPRSEAASSNGMDRQTLRDWVHRYNEAGIEGLKSRLPPGRTPYLTEQQMAELYDLVVKGPDPATAGVVRWRCVDLLAEAKRLFSVEVHESTMGKWLRYLRLTGCNLGQCIRRRSSKTRNFGADCTWHIDLRARACQHFGEPPRPQPKTVRRPRFSGQWDKLRTDRSKEA